jgi:hypothetical protein
MRPMRLGELLGGSLAALVTCACAVGCGGGDAGAADAALHDAESSTDGQPAADAGPDAVPCSGDVTLGGICTDDCDCVSGLACRGLPGERVCAVPCMGYGQCEGAEIGCESPICDLSLEACRCPCLEGECGSDEHCVLGYCVGCAEDAHCSEHSCSSTPGLDRPRCRLDTQTCVCGGKCGDGVCDDAEAATRTCPGDCTGPCTDGETLAYACLTGQMVTWCTCADGQWQCVDPVASCPGETECARMGGECVATTDSCYDGVVAAEAHGCAGDTALCCAPDGCLGPGETYYPVVGACCPGLRALSSAIPMESYIEGVEGLLCFANCWSLTCAPCGDGTCELHLGETPCTCPEDCPMPPVPFVCSDYAGECGPAFCRQEGTVCHQEIPTCAEHQCEWAVEDLEGQSCDPVTASCSP